MSASGWRGRAACRDHEPEWFFPAAVAGSVYEVQVERARSVCAGCPVLAPCRRWAIEELADGVAGGLTERERHRIRAQVSRPRVVRPVVTDPDEIPASAGRDAVRAAAVAAVATGVPRATVAAQFRVTPPHRRALAGPPPRRRHGPVRHERGAAMTVTEAELRRWVEAIRADPDRYRLDAYGPSVSVERTARYFATWAADEANRTVSPALCRRCGIRLTATQPGQQLHPNCAPPAAPRRGTVR